MQAQELAIGVDIGATKIATAVVSAQGEVLHALEQPTEVQNGQEDILRRVAEMIVQLLNQCQTAVVGIGVGTPGIVDPNAGIVRNAVNLGWTNVPVVPSLKRLVGDDLPIFLQRDTVAGTLGEYFLGAGAQSNHLVYLSIGSGLGAGAILNGQILTGATQGALELGHLALSFLDAPCACGRVGCIETVLSGNGVLATTLRQLQVDHQPSLLRKIPQLSPQDVIQAVQEGDGIARQVLQLAGKVLGVVFSICTAVLNPAVIVVGGGFGRAAFDLLLPPALEELERRVLPDVYQSLQIKPSRLTSSAIGAAALVWYGQNRSTG